MGVPAVTEKRRLLSRQGNLPAGSSADLHLLIATYQLATNMSGLWKR
jgi:hypothetical protein